VREKGSLVQKLITCTLDELWQIVSENKNEELKLERYIRVQTIISTWKLKLSAKLQEWELGDEPI